ncbi:acetyl-CoA carboxylase biotin carboxyl carrier protein [Weissella halotolerans]|uniref:Biotin carboxyl carrier protein of acetyl-CoA carboxylase n=1 Tax=Weissella halotolerans DSM 20190 TaxID=1123500 RepID=A0A0R2FYL0_9LACO|nr:acetyl-CoA carboxylase biotin carboxyl carrier protein [Weissella halotolerans]KRN33264.1 acetyl-CoA carboxylase, biotin carboxyl carrier protein [Weissella halotolerans DSM 20190]
MELSVTELKELMQTVEESTLREFNLAAGDFHLVLSKNEPAPVVTAGTAPLAQAESEPEVRVNQEATSDVPTLAQTTQETDGVTISAPLVGTVYLKPEPEKAPFAPLGSHVEAGDQVAIIEAMKLMTPVTTEVSGTVVEIAVSEEDMVDYGHAIMKIKPDV